MTIILIQNKQDTLRLAVIFWDDDEIIETLANLYVDLIASNTVDSYTEILKALNNASQGTESIRLEQKFLCSLWNENNDDLKIIAKIVDDLELNQSNMQWFKLLQKAMFLIKDSGKDNADLKYIKTRNLIQIIKRKNQIIVDDMDKVAQGDAFYSVNYRINNSINELQSEINDNKIRQKMNKLSAKKKPSKLNEIETKEIKVINQLLEAKSRDGVEEIIHFELSSYDENMREQSKKDLFIKKYGQRISNNLNLYHVLTLLFGEHQEALYSDLQDFHCFFPEFYLPLYFGINNDIFTDGKIPKSVSEYLINPYIKYQQEYAMYEFLQEHLLEKIFQNPTFAFYAEIVKNISESNIYYLINVLEDENSSFNSKFLCKGISNNDANMPDLDEAMCFLGLLVKKTFTSLRYIDVYDWTYPLSIITNFKLKLQSWQNHDCLRIALELAESIEEMYTQSAGKNAQYIDKVQGLKAQLFNILT